MALIEVFYDQRWQHYKFLEAQKAHNVQKIQYFRWISWHTGQNYAKKILIFFSLLRAIFYAFNKKNQEFENFALLVNKSQAVAICLLNNFQK